MTYGGPADIPEELAENLLEALNPILDILATENSHPTYGGKAHRKLEENRWSLWRAAQIAHEALASHYGTKTTWRSSPIRKRYDNERDIHRYRILWFEQRCGRPTKKGEPCKAPLRHGRARCWRHSTQEENEQLRIWQDQIHLPYPRVDCGKFVFDVNEVIEGLRAMAGDLS